MKPLISIVTPTLNEEVFLPRLLECFKQQTVKDFEIIVADGGSKDQTIQRIEPFKKDLTITVHQSQGGNVAHQRNIGAELAKGEYIFFIDSDSLVGPSCVEDVLKEVNKHPHGVYLPYVAPDSKSIILTLSYRFINGFVRFSQLLPRPLCSVGSMIIDRDQFFKIGKYEEDIYIGEDHNIVRKAKEAKIPIHCIYSVHITFSLRRMKQEGMLRTLYILFVGIFHALFAGDIKKPIFTYEMGGHLYQKSKTETMGK